ncbi:MAG: hypothetical protein NTV03_03150 [Candidatus Nomurabacteria bacterium]|nr:hypothetical protein [Candidatus Nomurabacteria bacterium]
MKNELIPTDKMTVSLPSGATVDLPICHPTFKKWLGELPNFDFGKKPVVNYKGKGVFAELAILGLLIDSGWDGVWVETYGGIHVLKDMPISWSLSPHNVSIPPDKEALLSNIWKTGKTTACFDVFAWKGNEVIFCEGKHKGKDKLTNAQTKFIEGALACGISAQSLMIVEWEY